jgi:hypothetical protein
MAKQPLQQGSSQTDVATAKKSAARRAVTYSAAFVTVCVVVELLSPETLSGRGWLHNLVPKAVMIGFLAFFVQAVFDIILDSVAKKKSTG